MGPEKVLLQRRDESMSFAPAKEIPSGSPNEEPNGADASTYPSFKQQWLQQLPQNVQSTSETISPPQKSFRELFHRL
jgi:hypothetical protein